MQRSSSLVGGDAREDSRGVASKEARDLGEAVVALRVVTQAPPELVSRPHDALRATGGADIDEEDAALAADVVRQFEEVAHAQGVEDGEASAGMCHAELLFVRQGLGEGVLSEGPSIRRVWQ